MADQDQKQQSQSDPVARTEAGDQNEYGTSEVDASYGSAEQEIKDRNAQTTSIHKDQYPQIQEDASMQSKDRGDKGDEYGTSEVDASYGSAEQEIKDRNAQTTSLHKDQYPQIQENPFVGGTEARGEAGDAGTSEKSV